MRAAERAVVFQRTIEPFRALQKQLLRKDAPRDAVPPAATSSLKRDSSEATQVIDGLEELLIPIRGGAEASPSYLDDYAL